jgi:hypothetical protein
MISKHLASLSLSVRLSHTPRMYSQWGTCVSLELLKEPMCTTANPNKPYVF